MYILLFFLSLYRRLLYLKNNLNSSFIFYVLFRTIYMKVIEINGEIILNNIHQNIF